MNDRQVGKFRISEELIRINPDQVAEVFKTLNAVVVRAEQLFASREIEYIALSPYFECVPQGNIPAEYSLVVDKKTETAGVLKVIPANPSVGMAGFPIAIIESE